MNKRIQELRAAMRRAIEVIEEQADRTLDGSRPNWKRAAHAAVEELYGELSRDAEDEFTQQCRRKDRGAPLDSSFIQGFACAAAMLVHTYDQPSMALDLLENGNLKDESLLRGAGVDQADLATLFPPKSS